MGETPPAEQFSVPESTLPPTLELTCRRIFAAIQMAASLGPGATRRSPLCRGRSAASLSAVSWGRSGGRGQGHGSAWAWQHRMGIKILAPFELVLVTDDLFELVGE